MSLIILVSRRRAALFASLCSLNRPTIDRIFDLKQTGITSEIVRVRHHYSVVTVMMNAISFGFGIIHPGAEIHLQSPGAES